MREPFDDSVRTDPIAQQRLAILSMGAPETNVPEQDELNGRFNNLSGAEQQRIMRAVAARGGVVSASVFDEIISCIG